jgi:hypothetical protein
MLEQLEIVRVVRSRLWCCVDRSRVEGEVGTGERRREDENFRREN